MKEKGNLTTWVLLLIMPLLIIGWAGIKMAQAQVRSQFDHFTSIVEYNDLSSLQTAAPDATVMVRGRIIDAEPVDWAGGLVVFQERPLDGRELRYGETFPYTFPQLTLSLDDGNVVVQPDPNGENVVTDALHSVRDENADVMREFTGFRNGDLVTIQGHWDAADGRIVDATGITGLDQQAYTADWQKNFERFNTAGTLMGTITLLTIGLFAIQVWRARKQTAIA